MEIITLLHVALLGIFRGLISLAWEHPFDVLKTSAQANLEKKSLLKIMRAIVTNKGWLGFYSGALPNSIRMATKQAYRYPLMLALPFVFGKISSSITVISLCTGFSIALFEIAIITPLERLKVWNITFKNRSGALNEFFKNKHILKELYKGIEPTALKQIVTWCTFLVVHDHLMDLFNHSLSLSIVLVTALFEGAINTAVVMPFDCIKTQMQKIDAKNQSSLSIVTHVYKQHGIKGLYAGWQVKFVQFMIHALFTVSILENFRTK